MEREKVWFNWNDRLLPNEHAVAYKLGKALVEAGVPAHNCPGLQKNPAKITNSIF